MTKTAAVVIGVVVTAATLVGCGSGAAGPVMLHLFSNAQDADQAGTAAAECSRASGGRYTIAQQTEPVRGSNDQRLQLARRLATTDPSLDIMELDVNWTAEFAKAGWILPYPPEVAQRIARGTLRASLDTGTYQGTLYAAPLGAGVQLLWYRKDLVPHPPRTWDEMIQMAESLAARGLPHYIEVQGGLSEGLTVWFNTLLASGGGAIVSENGDVQVARGDAAWQALNIMRRIAASVAADPSLSVSEEDNARLAMQAGTAAFEVNYPFVYASMQQDAGGTFINPLGRPTTRNTGRRVGDVFGWAPYPSITAGTPARVTVGGVNLGVNAASRHPAEAFEAVQCLRNRDNQLRNALEKDRSPTLTALYDDPAFQRRYPAWREIRDALDSASVRPKTPAYTSISLVISHLLNPPVKINPDTVVGQLADQINETVASQGVVP